VQPCRGRDDRRHAGGDGDRHREDVVGEERHTRHLGRQHAEVVLRDDVGPAGRRIRLDRLPVAELSHKSGAKKPNPAAVIMTPRAEGRE